MADTNINIEQLANIISNGKKSTSYDRLLDKLERVSDKMERANDNDGVSKRYMEMLAEEQKRLKAAAESQMKASESLVSTLKTLTHGRKDYSQEMVNNVMQARVEWVKLNEQFKELNQQLKREQRRKNKDVDEINSLNKQIDKIKKEQSDILNKIKKDYGDGSVAEKAVEEVTKSRKKQKEISDAINASEEASVDNTREYNKELERSKKQLEDINKTWESIKAVARKTWQHVESGGNMWIKFNQEAISGAKMLGMTTRSEALAYTRTLIDNSKELARNYGMTAEQAMKLQNTYVKVTGRATFLSKSQMEDIAASSKIMGDETVQGAIKIMDSMGATSQSTVELLDKNYARAKNAGLDINKASEALVQNLSLANKLNFRSGVDGISKMTIYSQRIRMNLQEVANVADKFSTIEGALEGSARLQMLGGTGAMYGSNPMAMMYEAMADPEALFKRMGKMFSTQAYFDKRTGEARIDPVQMAIMREQAKAMGMNPDEAIQSAKQQAKLRSIENDLRAANPSLFNSMTDDQKAAIGNKAEYSKESGWTVTYFDESKGVNVTSSVDRLTASQLEKITKDNKEPVEDIRDRVRDIAKELISFRERVDSMKDQWKMGIAKLLHLPMAGMNNGLEGVNGSDIWGGLTGGGFGTGIGLAGIAAGTAIQISLSAKGVKYAKQMLGAMKGYEAAGRTAEVTSEIKNASNLEKVASAGKETNALKNFSNLKNLKNLKWGGKAVGGSVLAIGAELFTAGLDWYSANEQRKADEDRLVKLSGVKNAVTGGNRFSEKDLKYQDITSKNTEKKEKWGAWGRGGAAAIGAAIGAVVGGPVGLAIGAMAGGYIGNWAGKKLAPEEYEGKIGEHLKEIGKDGTKENIRKIILPVESIDYNVSLIANKLGILSATPARGNIYLESEIAGEHTVEVQELNASHVNQQDSNVVYNSQYQPRGPLTLNINGSIDLNMKGTNIGNLSAADFKKMFESNPELQRWLTGGIANELVRRGNAGRYNQEATDNRIVAMPDSYKSRG